MAKKKKGAGLHCRVAPSIICMMLFFTFLAVALAFSSYRASKFSPLTSSPLHTMPPQKNAGAPLSGSAQQHGSAASDAILHTPPVGCTPKDCKDAEPFGTPLGAHEGVVGYSNCASDTCISELYHTVDHAPQQHNTAMKEDEEHQRSRRSANASNPVDRHEGVNDVPDPLPFWKSSGMKWQCVEYARRYWMLHGCRTPSQSSLTGPHSPSYCAATFGDVDGAEDIWHLEEVHVAIPKQTAAGPSPPSRFSLNDTLASSFVLKAVPLLKIPNAERTLASALSHPHVKGENTTAAGAEREQEPQQVRSSRTPQSPSLAVPHIGDLVLYPRDDVEFPYGHVAVIVGVHTHETPQSSAVSSSTSIPDSPAESEWVEQTGFVFLAEQNWDNKKWVNKNYSRTLTLSWERHRDNGTTRHYCIHDTVKPIMGWVRPCLESPCTVSN